MGCINNIRIKDKKFTSIITSNQLQNEANEKMKLSQPLNKQIFLNRHFEDIPQTHISQNIDDLIENNPLPFVKIKKKKNSMQI